MRNKLFGAKLRCVHLMKKFLIFLQKYFFKLFFNVFVFNNFLTLMFLKPLMCNISTLKTDFCKLLFSFVCSCTFSHCVKSHMVIVRPAFPSSVTLGDLEEYDQLFENIEKIFVISSSQGIPENITVLAFFDIKIGELFYV